MFKNRADMRSRILSVAAASALGMTGMAVAAAPAGAQFAKLTDATHLGQGDVVQSATPLTRNVHVTVALKLRNEGQLGSFIANARQPGTPVAQRVMSRAQLSANYLPTQAQAQAVAEYLTHAGFSNVHIAPDRMLVTGDASAASVQAAFKTSLVNVRTSDGRDAFANNSPIQIPAALQANVRAVLGLQTVHKAHTMVRGSSPNLGGSGSTGQSPSQRGSDPQALPGGIMGHDPLDFASIYDANGLAPATDVNVAVFGWGSMAPTVSDLGQFISDNGLAPVNTEVVCIDYNGYDAGGFSTTDPACNSYDQGSIEWDLDSQDIVAMTGGVKSLTFYAAYGGYNDSVTNALNEIVTPTQGEPLAQVVNQSFGECERNEDANQGGDGSMQADDALYQLGTAQGQTFSASTGDHGSNECGDGQLDSASYPASSPWNVAVSGTTLHASTTTWAREDVWAGTGGSPSSAETAQPWQTGLTYGTYAGARGPDVAFDASPSSGADVYVSADGGYIKVGGTSLASPLFVGAWARILESDPGLGFAAPNLYALPASDFHDIRSGNNGQYIARRGWDWASGLGSFDVSKAAAALK